MSSRRASSRIAAMKKTSAPTRVTASTASTGSSERAPTPAAAATSAEPASKRASAASGLPTPDLPVRLFPAADDFAAYLAAHHATSPGLLLQIAKAACPTPSVTYAAAVATALRYGWIDGQRRAHPTDPRRFFLQRFTPRRKGSLWSRRNVGIAEGLMAEGRMEPGGLREVARAREDGRWARAYAGQREMVVPGDLEAAVRAEGRARGAWEGMTRSRRYALVLRVETAKRAETRARRVEQIARELTEGAV